MSAGARAAWEVLTEKRREMVGEVVSRGHRSYSDKGTTDPNPLWKRREASANSSGVAVK
jgi:hypothetical protein